MSLYISYLCPLKGLISNGLPTSQIIKSWFLNISFFPKRNKVPWEGKTNSRAGEERKQDKFGIYFKYMSRSKEVFKQ